MTIPQPISIVARVSTKNTYKAVFLVVIVLFILGVIIAFLDSGTSNYRPRLSDVQREKAAHKMPSLPPVYP